ncbi:MAG: hypothetical protein KF752_11765 [Pirellulaceae bacterium]|nr:hypothetical protein [Pirellulaceae bacterium]
MSRQRGPGRPKTGKSKCRQIGRLPDHVWRSVMRGFMASGCKNFTRWATSAMLKQAEQDLRIRKQIDRLTDTITKYDCGEIHGINIDRSRKKLAKLLELIDQAVQG